MRLVIRALLAVLNWYNGLKAGFALRRMSRDFAWLEGYLRSTHMSRQERRRHLRKMTALTYRIAQLTNLKEGSTP